jgi:hypothetical protein
MKTSNIILIVAALIVAAGAYWYFFTGTGTNAPLTASTATDNVSQAQFQTLVSELQPITFDTSIFSDPRFMALVDLTTPITPEQTGRTDPFAPVPGISGK